jgi:hypothetical protein
MTTPAEMMETLGIDVLSNYVELTIGKTPNGLLVKRIDGIKDEEIVPEFRKYDDFMATCSLTSCHLNAE